MNGKDNSLNRHANEIINNENISAQKKRKIQDTFIQVEQMIQKTRHQIGKLDNYQKVQRTTGVNSYRKSKS